MKAHVDQGRTVAAISTPPGAGGIGIVRMSGDRSLTVLREVFVAKDQACSFASHRLYYGHIVDPESNRVVDEVLAVYMQSPQSYTREDVVEIHCHGSFLVLRNVLELLLSRGVSLAPPGEFTKRAFLNGRIDLTRAEAVIDLLGARTNKGVDLAQEQLGGALFERIEALRKSLIRMRAIIEVAIDFPDEDVEIVDHGHLIEQLQQEVMEPLEKLLRNADQGRMYREGIMVVIAGLPNVGKSSLLNTLLQEERALVTEVPGTTRDTIEEYIDIEGMPVRLVDTAGIRESAGQVEELGIQRARGLINEADLVLFLLDGAREITQEDRNLFASVCHKPLLIVINKTDAVKRGDQFVSPLDTTAPVVHISAREQYGIDELKAAVFQRVTSGADQWEEGGCAPNLRHKNALINAGKACKQVQDALVHNLTSDLIAVDLQECLDQLGVIVGDTTTEDILDVIFEQFCLGK